MLSKANEVLDRNLRHLSVILFGILLFFMVLGLVSRLINYPIFWTEEAARYIFIWGTLLEIVIVLRKKQHVSIDLFVNLLPEKIREPLSLCATSLVFLFVIILNFYSIKMSLLTWDIPTTSLGLSWGIIYLGLVGATFLMAISLLQQICSYFSKLKDGK